MTYSFIASWALRSRREDALVEEKSILRKMPITYRATMIATSRTQLIDNRASKIAIDPNNAAKFLRKYNKNNISGKKRA